MVLDIRSAYMGALIARKALLMALKDPKSLFLAKMSILATFDKALEEAFMEVTGESFKALHETQKVDT